MNEEFDEWARTNMVDDTGYIEAYGRMEQAYLAGVAAGYANGVAVMKERCAEVAEADDTCECGCSSDYECNHCAIKNNIAAAIRGQEI